MLITRFYAKLQSWVIPGKVLLIFGPRQVGKTTLIKGYYDSFRQSKLFLNGDDLQVRDVLSSEDAARILGRVDGYSLLVIDEAQRIPGIGLTLKIMVDNRPDLEIIATGSSSFELMGQVGEPLTGRKQTLLLYPIWVGELLDRYNRFELDAAVPDFLIYGMYPEVIMTDNKKRKVELLNELTNSYLLKDILELDKVKAAQPVINLLRLLAHQVGNEVSVNELALKTSLDSKTVSRYLDLFEKSHIIIKLGGFSRNLRKEITSKCKYYFYDNGIRNALISSYNSLELRSDVGALWENFIVTQRLMKRSYLGIYANQYFWRTWEQQEIDLIEEREGKLFAYEIKWQETRVKSPNVFLKAYPEGLFEVIHRQNYLDFIL